MITGRSVTGILHLLNQTPFDWYIKKQNTVETSTYGSEFTAARNTTDQIITNRNLLRYLGVTVKSMIYLFGDNQLVVNTSNVPQYKRHNALSFHRVREAVAAKILSFNHIPGNINPADVLSKHWGYQQIKEILKTILFYRGDTKELFNKEKNDTRTTEWFHSRIMGSDKFLGNPLIQPIKIYERICQTMNFVRKIPSKILYVKKKKTKYGRTKITYAKMNNYAIYVFLNQD